MKIKRRPGPTVVPLGVTLSLIGVANGRINDVAAQRDAATAKIVAARAVIAAGGPPDEVLRAVEAVLS